MLTDEAARQIINAYAGDIGRDPQAAMLLLVRLGYAQALKDAAEVCADHASCEGIAQTCAAAILALGKERQKKTPTEAGAKPRGQGGEMSP